MRFPCLTIIPRPPPWSVMKAAALARAILGALPARGLDVRGWLDVEVDEAMKAVRRIFAIGGTARDQLIQIETPMFGQ